MKKLGLTLSASRIGSYYQKKCLRGLIYEAASASQILDALGWPATKTGDSSDALAGQKWETELLERLKKQNETVIEINKSDEDKKNKLSFDQTIEALRSLNHKDCDALYIYQGCVKATDGFLNKYVYSSITVQDNFHVLDNFHFSFMYLDLIHAVYDESKNKFCLTIIDIKNADHLKSGAQIQVALYAYLLDEMLKEHGIDNCYANLEYGLVWNKEPITRNLLPHSFHLDEAKKELDVFFEESLPMLNEAITSSADGDYLFDHLDCYLSRACENCGCIDRCLKKAKDQHSTYILPYITPEAIKRVEELIANEDVPEITDDSFDNVAALLENDKHTLLTDNCGYWKMVKQDITVYKEAMEDLYSDKAVTEESKYYKSGSSLTLPRFQHFALALTAHRDPDSGRVYAYAWKLQKHKDSPYDGPEENVCIASKHDTRHFDIIDSIFVNDIYNVLKHIDRLPEGSKTLQMYVPERYELDNIEDALFYMLERLDANKEEDKVLLHKVTTLLFWLQNERLVTDSATQPTEAIEHPVSILANDVAQLYALPFALMYSLKNISTIFSPKYMFDATSDAYFPTLSSTLDGMPIYHIWHGGMSANSQKNALDKLSKHLLMRVRVVTNIVSAIQKDAENKLVVLGARAKEYTTPEIQTEQYPEISRLAFENQYEELLKYKQIRYSRMKGIDRAIDDGKLLSVQYIGNNQYKVLNRDSFIGYDWFSKWICEDNEASRIQLLMLRDIEYNNSFSTSIIAPDLSGKRIPMFFSADNQNPVEENVKFVNDELITIFKSSNRFFRPQLNKTYLLFEMYKDFNSAKTLRALNKLQYHPEFLYPKMLSKATDVDWNENVESVCSRFWSPDGYTFSASQKKAFVHLFNRKLTVLVGPPAAGKTDFIGRSVITLAKYYACAKNKHLKILVSAMSHSAINNVLIKLVKMLNEGKMSQDIKLYKAETYREKNPELELNVSLCDVKRDEEHPYTYFIGDILNDKQETSVIGMTGWSISKCDYLFKDPKNSFDLIILDEASQVRAMDAFIQLQTCNQNTRYLLVGDDYQLPPIIGGDYQSSEGQTYIYGSVFKLFLTGLENAGDNAKNDIVQLSDNFRMNNILCRYSANEIYGPSYLATIPSIANQKLSLKATSQHSDETLRAFLDFVLDPDYPLVYCQISGPSGSAKKTEIEAVTEIVAELKNNLLNRNSLAGLNGSFWDEHTVKYEEDGEEKTIVYDGACGIISPHHEHINQVKNAIAQRTGDDRSKIFIGTVDKLQGKERLCVMVSYGVTDEETIGNESEFIFSRNRFNVSLTRGKAKTIVFLSDVLATPNLITNNLKNKSESLSDGISFLHGFGVFMKNAAPDEAIESTSLAWPGCNDITINIYKKKLRE